MVAALALATAGPAFAADPWVSPAIIGPDGILSAARPGAAPAFRAGVAHDEYLALCERVRKLSGVDLLQYKRGQMERRVRTFAQRRGTPDLTAYGARLKAETDELDAFLDRVTINVSHLWRHEEQWDALHKQILRSRVFVALHMHAGDGNVHACVLVDAGQASIATVACASIGC